MATQECFLEQIEKLKKEYGNYYYPEMREELLWDMVSGISNRDLIEMVDELIDTYKFAPVLEEFRYAIKKRDKEITVEVLLDSLRNAREGLDNYLRKCNIAQAARKLSGHKDTNTAA